MLADCSSEGDEKLCVLCTVDLALGVALSETEIYWILFSRLTMDFLFYFIISTSYDRSTPLRFVEEISNLYSEEFFSLCSKEQLHFMRLWLHMIQFRTALPSSSMKCLSTSEMGKNIFVLIVTLMMM